jgi:hypothetical protein
MLVEYILTKQNEILKMAHDPDSFPGFNWVIDPELFAMTYRLRQCMSDDWHRLPFGITKQGIENDRFMQKWLDFDVTSPKARPLMTGEYKVYILNPEERNKAFVFYSRQVSSIARLWDAILEKNSRELLEKEREVCVAINWERLHAQKRDLLVAIGLRSHQLRPSQRSPFSW